MTNLKYIRSMLVFIKYIVTSRGYVEWGTEDTGYIKEYWGRRKMWLLRPRYNGFIRELPCGCSKRFGKFVYYRWRCVEQHGNLNKRLVEREA